MYCWISYFPTQFMAGDVSQFKNEIFHLPWFPQWKPSFLFPVLIVESWKVRQWSLYPESDIFDITCRRSQLFRSMLYLLQLRSPCLLDNCWFHQPLHVCIHCDVSKIHDTWNIVRDCGRKDNHWDSECFVLVPSVIYIMRPVLSDIYIVQGPSYLFSDNCSTEWKASKPPITTRPWCFVICGLKWST